MFTLKRNSMVYIACPPNFVTGGTELLHQLCYCLNQKGVQAKMCYTDNENKIYADATAPSAFASYSTSAVASLDDNTNNLLIVPEALSGFLKSVHHSKKCIWWLGINHYLLKSEISPHPYGRVIYHYLLNFLGIKKALTFREMRENHIVHLVQCWYVASFLNQKKIHNMAYLSDYINAEYIQAAQKESGERKQDIVLYNPKRNTKYVEAIREAAPEIKFVPIQNMTRQEVVDLMCRSKVYVDFGSHPGKDRMPREAALCGCCIFTSFLGSANFYDDVPLSSDFKFERTKKNIPAVIEKIKGVFSNYEEERKQFDAYREFIKSEKDQFEKSVEKLFVLSE